MPAMQLIAIYEQYAGQNVIIPPELRLNATIYVAATQPLTRQEAAMLIEDALREQAHIEIVRTSDGKLTVKSDQPGSQP